MTILVASILIVVASATASLAESTPVGGSSRLESTSSNDFPPHSYSNSTRCCARLTQTLGRSASYPSDAIYREQTAGLPHAGYWSLQESELSPSCRVTPTTSTEVAEAVRLLASSNCSFAIRSGGHASFAGAANIGSSGVTVDLSALNQVVLSKDNAVASVGPGARWSDVYTKLKPKGLAVSGGRVATVGVGGLTLGGGKTFFASQHGFACDGVRNFELITANGQILQVNSQTFPDLFKALKGGSNNFGVVSRFDLQTFRQGDLWAGQFIYPETVLNSSLDALYHFAEVTGAQKNRRTMLKSSLRTPLCGSGGRLAQKVVTAFLSYSAPVVSPPIFSNFTSLTHQVSNSSRISNLADFGRELNTGTPNGQRYLFATATFQNNLPFIKELLKKSAEIFDPLYEQKVTGLSPSTVLQPLTKPMLAPGCGHNALGLCPSDGNLMILDLTVIWQDKTHDKIVEDAAAQLVDWTVARSKQLGIHNRYIYLNYAQNNQKPFPGYGRASHEFLKEVSRKYDPTGVFQRLVPGGFKL